MKKYIKPNIEVVAGCLEWTIMVDLSDSPNSNPAITKDAGEWDIEDDSDGW
ncbi:MAG: hypothetical protein LUI08_07320 [Prevotella sp.]|nr:hypothetical protein [Prevotella sp.]